MAALLADAEAETLGLDGGSEGIEEGDGLAQAASVNSTVTASMQARGRVALGVMVMVMLRRLPRGRAGGCASR